MDGIDTIIGKREHRAKEYERSQDVETGAAFVDAPSAEMDAGSARPLRVAHLTTTDMSLAWLLATELRVDLEAGCTTFGISAPGPFVPQVEDVGVTHVPIPSLSRAWGLRGDLAAARELAGVLRKLNLDVLHTHNPKTGVLGRVIGRLLRIPVVVNTCHGLWIVPEAKLTRKAFVYGVEGIAGRFSHAELYQNDEDRRVLSRYVGGLQRTVGNGVDLRRFRHSESARARVRAELGVPDDAVLVGGVGRRVAEKGIVEFAAAARALGEQATFVWVGPVHEAQPDALCESERGVRFLGMREDMRDLYSAFDVFVLPSYREGFSRSSMEAAACGCAMVLTDIRGCREIGAHGDHLLLVPPRDAEALTAAVRRLVDDADLRSRLGEAARERAHREFDQRAVAAASLGTYAQVARRRGLPWADRVLAAAQRAANAGRSPH